MPVTRTDRGVLIFSLLASAYFAFLALNFYVFRLDWILLGVVQELLTIPMIMAVAAVFVFSVVSLLRNWQSINACNISSTLLLLSLNCCIWGSFVF